MHDFSPPLNEDTLLSRILYRDALLIVLNKPSGIAVHAAGPKRHNLEQYFDALRFGLPKKPHLAHRLDRDTSGCLVLARNAFAARRMQELFTAGLVKKAYLALVEGVVQQDKGLLDIPLERQSKESSNWRMKADINGSMPAKTDYEVLARHAHQTLLKLIPHTGRTHQLRVHCQALGHPIMGDVIYGTGDGKIPLHLHAHTIEIPLYKNKAPITIEAPVPDYMAGWL